MDIRKEIIGIMENKVAKKLISLNLTEDKIDILDSIAEFFNDVSGTNSYSRNHLIDKAIDSYIETVKDTLKKEYDFNIDKEIIGTLSSDYDTIILPAHDEGFLEVFMKQQKWYSFRIDEGRIDKVKYIAIYRSAPISGITHFAEIKEVRQYKNTKKKEAILKSKPVELEKPVVLGKYSAVGMRTPRYVKLSKLKKSDNIQELFD
jgi:hypothetical protein